MLFLTIDPSFTSLQQLTPLKKLLTPRLTMHSLADRLLENKDHRYYLYPTYFPMKIIHSSVRNFLFLSKHSLVQENTNHVKTNNYYSCYLCNK
jgi:hypothetical protein